MAVDWTVSYQGTRQDWRGVLKQEGRVVWVCRHSHFLRDQSTRNHVAAQACADMQLFVLSLAAKGLVRNLHHMGGHVTRRGTSEELATVGSPWE